MIREIYHFIIKNKIPTIACSLAFNIILNGGAFIFLYIVFSNIFNGGFNNIFIENLEDGGLKDLIVYFFDYQNSIAYSFFLVLSSLYSASSFYYHLIVGVELMNNRHFSSAIPKRLFSIIITIILLISINLLLFFITESLFKNDISVYLLIIIILIVVGLILYFINYLGVNSFKFKLIWKGFLFSFLYFVLFTIGFIVYLRLFSNFKMIYGVLSFLFILFFYIYIVCIGILMGIKINCYKEEKYEKNNFEGGEKSEKSIFHIFD